MSISFSRYIDIASFIGAPTLVQERNHGLRLFTTNNLLPPDSFIQTTEADDSKTYFGSASTEYARAVPYFSFISKEGTSPNLLSYARWVDEDVAPMIFGNVQTQTVATYTGISTGSFTMTIGGVTNIFTALDFTAALSLADVADVIQTAINAATGTQWTAATVVYDATRGSFNFVGGSAVAADISVANHTSGVNVLPLLGWLTGAILCNGALEESITEVLDNSFSASNNFGSYDFIPVLTQDEIVEAATWTHSLDVQVMFVPPILAANASTYSAAVAAYSGVGFTLSPLSTQYPEQIPAMIFASTNYNRTNSVQNFMYQVIPGITPSVSTDADANTYDSLKINYYGNTQTAGAQISFYQRGLLSGPANYPSDMNVFANEIWLKDAAGTALMNLFLTQTKVSANAQGRGQILAVLQQVVDRALNNGTISVGKTLTVEQKAYITSITDDTEAWKQVENDGYWLDCIMVPYINQQTQLTEYKAVYTLIYSKDDDVRKVEGTHVLI